MTTTVNPNGHTINGVLLELISRKALTEWFNAHSPTPVARFSDGVTAVRRVAKLMDELQPAPVEVLKAEPTKEEKPAHVLASPKDMDLVDCPRCGKKDEVALLCDDPEKLLNAFERCYRCNITFNRFTWMEVDLEEPKKAKRTRLLNPQYVIDRKRDAIEKAGGELVFQNRKWVLIRKNGSTETMTSEGLSRLDENDLVAMVREETE